MRSHFRIFTRALSLAAAAWLFTAAAGSVSASPQQPTSQPSGPQAPGASLGAAKKSSNPAIGFVEKLFTAKPAHFIVQGVVPGSGTGGGGTYVHDFDLDPWHRQFKATGLVTIRRFAQGELQLRFAHEPFVPWNLPPSVHDSFVTHTYARARNLERMPFYGLGPNPNFANESFFRERDYVAGIDATNPLSSWLDVGGRLETLWHSVAGVSSPAAQSITVLYPGTPGTSPQPNLLHYELFLIPHYPAQPPFNIHYKLSYGFYQDHDTGQFSFRRFTLNAYNNIYPFKIAPQTRGPQPPGAGGGAAGEGGRTQRPNPDIFFTLHALIAASDASAGHFVPFYLQPTLGGTDANNEPTLRGYKDFQFRGPNAILFQAEYNHRLWKYLGAYAFYDAGKVTLRKGDLNFGDLRQSYGFGVSFWMNDLVLFKIYVGLGSGQGAHPFFGIPNFTGETVLAGRGPAATPWD